MADSRITDEAAITTVADGDVFGVIDVSDTTDNAAGSDKKIVASDLANEMLARNEVAQTVTGTTDTLAAGDLRRLTLYSNASQVTVTVPTGTFSAGDWFLLQSTGAGGLTLSTTSITLNGTAPKVTVADSEALYIEFTAADTITVTGGTS